MSFRRAVEVKRSAGVKPLDLPDTSDLSEAEKGVVIAKWLPVLYGYGSVVIDDVVKHYLQERCDSNGTPLVAYSPIRSDHADDLCWAMQGRLKKDLHAVSYRRSCERANDHNDIVYAHLHQLVAMFDSMRPVAVAPYVSVFVRSGINTAVQLTVAHARLASVLMPDARPEDIVDTLNASPLLTGLARMKLRHFVGARNALLISPRDAECIILDPAAFVIEGAARARRVRSVVSLDDLVPPPNEIGHRIVDINGDPWSDRPASEDPNNLPGEATGCPALLPGARGDKTAFRQFTASIYQSLLVSGALSAQQRAGLPDGVGTSSAARTLAAGWQPSLAPSLV